MSDSQSKDPRSIVFLEGTPIQEIPPIQGVRNVLYIHVLPRFNGDNIIVQIPDDKDNYTNLLIDSGGYDEKFFVDYTKRFHIKSIDYIVITHAHHDHYCGIEPMLRSLLDPTKDDMEKPKVNINNLQIWEPDPYPNEDRFFSYMQLKKKYLEKELKPKPKMLSYPSRIAKIVPISKATLTFVGPSKKFLDGVHSRPKFKRNMSSLVFFMDYENSFLLFTGDAENGDNPTIVSGEWEDILIEINLKKIPSNFFNFMKLPHHGSENGLPPIEDQINLNGGFAIATRHLSYNEKDYGDLKKQLPPKSQEKEKLTLQYYILEPDIHSVNYDLRNYGSFNIPLSYIYAAVPLKIKKDNIEIVSVHLVSFKLFGASTFGDLHTKEGDEITLPNEKMEDRYLIMHARTSNNRDIEYFALLEPSTPGQPRKVHLISWRTFQENTQKQI